LCSKLLIFVTKWGCRAQLSGGVADIIIKLNCPSSQREPGNAVDDVEFSHTTIVCLNPPGENERSGGTFQAIIREI
jgi:hypothetical protein